MFRVIAVAVIAVLILGVGLNGCTQVRPGYVGVVVNQWGQRGTEDTPRPPGYYFMGPFQTLYEFPTWTQNYTWDNVIDKDSPTDESISFNDKEGMPVNVDLGISYSISPVKAPIVFQKYRTTVREITHVVLRNAVRDALVDEAATHTIDEIYGAQKAQILKAVENQVRTTFSPLGIELERLSWVGRPRMPKSIEDSINAKLQAVQMTQQRENEIAQVRAEAQKHIEQAKGVAQATLLQAQATAESNRLIASSLTPQLIQSRALEKWDGVLPRMTGGTAAIPFINAETFGAHTPNPDSRTR